MWEVMEKKHLQERHAPGGSFERRPELSGLPSVHTALPVEKMTGAKSQKHEWVCLRMDRKVEGLINTGKTRV